MGWDDSAPTAQEMNTGGWDAAAPTSKELGSSGQNPWNPFNPILNRMHKAGEERVALMQAQKDWESKNPAQPTAESAIDYANNSPMGQNQKTFAMNMASGAMANPDLAISEMSPTMGGISDMVKSGKAKISGLISAKEGLKPVIEIADDSGAAAKGYKLNLNALKMNEPLFQGLKPVIEIADDSGAAAKGYKLNLNALKMNEPLFQNVAQPAAEAAPEVAAKSVASEAIPGKEVIQEAAHHLGLPSKAQAAGGVAGAFIAHHLGLPEWMGAVAGAKTAPYVVNAYVKTANGIMPIIEENSSMIGNLGRAAVATEQSGDK
jgi:hypothetical protein